MANTISILYALLLLFLCIGVDRCSHREVPSRDQTIGGIRSSFRTYLVQGEFFRSQSRLTNNGACCTAMAGNMRFVLMSRTAPVISHSGIIWMLIVVSDVSRPGTPDMRRHTSKIPEATLFEELRFGTARMFDAAIVDELRFYSTRLPDAAIPEELRTYGARSSSFSLSRRCHGDQVTPYTLYHICQTLSHELRQHGTERPRTSSPLDLHAYTTRTIHITIPVLIHEWITQKTRQSSGISRTVDMVLSLSPLPNVSLPHQDCNLTAQCRVCGRTAFTLVISTLFHWNASRLGRTAFLVHHDCRCFLSQTADDAECRSITATVSVLLQILQQFPISLMADVSEEMFLLHCVSWHQRTKGADSLFDMVDNVTFCANESLSRLVSYHSLSVLGELSPNAQNQLISTRFTFLNKPVRRHRKLIKGNISLKYVTNTRMYIHTLYPPKDFSSHFLSMHCKYAMKGLCFLVSLVYFLSCLYSKDREKVNTKSVVKGRLSCDLQSDKEKYRTDGNNYCFSKQFMLDTADDLYGIINHPWRRGLQGLNNVDAHASVPVHQCGNPPCLSFSSSVLCSACQNSLRSHPRESQNLKDTTREPDTPAMFSERAVFSSQPAIHVYPVTRFLPDPSSDPSQNLAHVGYRLASLSALPVSVPVSRVRLADAGFFSQGVGDEVACYSCHVRHSGWTADDNPLEVHRRLSPDCAHVRQHDEMVARVAATFGTETTAPSHTGGNTDPSTQTSLPPASFISNSLPGDRSGDVQHIPADPSGRHAGVRSLPAERTHPESIPAAAVPRTTASGSSVTVTSDAESQGSSASENPQRSLFPRATLDLGSAVYPMYQDMASRRRTFTTWDETRAPPLNQLLLCGMFYAGYSDCVRCFYCGVGLKRWVVTDSVWDEHVRWRPECQYLRAIKGDAFIRNTQRRLGTSTSESSQTPRRNPNTATTTASTRSTPRLPITSSTTVGTARPQVQTTASNATQTTTSSSTPHQPAARTTPAQTNQRPQSSSSARASESRAADRPPAAAGPARPGDGPPSCSSRSGVGSISVGQGMVNGEREAGSGTVASSSASDQQQVVERMEAENRTLAHNLQCRVCRQAPVDTIIMPCAHLVICQTCAASVTSCPHCSGPVRATARVFMS